MTTATFRDPDTGHVKEPGEWRRKGVNGPPIVTDVNGETVKKGTNAGRVKLHTYSRPSNFGKQVENTYNLERWKNRQGVIGMYLAPELLDEMHVLWNQEDHDTAAWKEAVDSIYKRASEAAGGMTAAERGTFGHLLTEDHDLGRSLITRIEEGEDLGLPPALQAAIQVAWAKLVDEHFEILAVEAPCVYDHWRVAGTLDRIVRLKHEMTFATPSGPVTFPAGAVVVLDIKTGGLKVAPRTQTPMYWHGYAVQIAAYARSVPYDVDAEKRGTWPWDINPNHAIIAHIDIGAALDTDVVSARLIYVDLAAGHEAGDLVVEAKAWQKQEDVFGTVDCYEVNVPVEVEAEASPAAVALAEDFEQEQAQRKEALYARYDKLSQTDQDIFGARAAGIDTSDLDAVEALLDAIENPPTTLDLAKKRMADDAKRESDRRLSAEGGPASEDDVKVFEARWELGMREHAKKWTGKIVKEAIDAGADFRLSTLNTQRRADIYCALTEWATTDLYDPKDDAPFRAAIVAALDGDTAPAGDVMTAPLGLLLGELTTTQAAHLRLVVTEIARDRMALAYTDDGTPTWVPNPNPSTSESESE